MNEQSMTGKTTAMTAKTMSMTLGAPRQPSARALATRSLTAAGRLTGDARREALEQHAAKVWPSKACSMLGRTT